MTRAGQQAVLGFFRHLTGLLCRIDDCQLQQVPSRGPLIVISNHVGLVELPVLFTRLQPRPVTGFVAAERFRNRWSRWLLQTFGAIPLRRGEADAEALRRGLEVLESGSMLLILPEGTRSRDGRLQRGHAGVVFLALRSGAPVLPLAHHGSERLAQNLRRCRRTDFHIAVGKPFVFDIPSVSVPREVRQRLIDEAMAQLAALLPPDYRGAYANLAAAAPRHLRFLSSSE